MSEPGIPPKEEPEGGGRASGTGDQTAPKVEEVLSAPDPDEDDLDDLDDLLDDFSAVKVQPESKGEALAPEEHKAEDAVDEPTLSDDEFSKQLEAGMAQLLGEIDSSPEMRAQFESIFQELAAEGAAEPSQAGTQAPPLGAGTDSSFQHTIRQTMERMQTSGDRATSAATADAENPDDFMAELLKQMQAGGMEGEANEAEFSKMLMGMMEQLTNKEILYEPMKELNDRFPAWLDKNRGSIDKADLARYEEQHRLVREIAAKFEEPTYSDSNASDREYIVDRMQKMQAAGAPPAELVGDMPSAQDAFNVPDESCNTQ